ncbi:MAG: molybdopterin-dependent oxidoreductase, partial [Halodesulfovibrio sp.]
MSMNRRDFIKSAAAATAFMALGAPCAFAAPKDTVDKWVKGVCRYCGTGCGVLVGVKDGRVTMVKGDPNNHNEGLLCLKGALLPAVINSPNRVTDPLVRKDGKLVPVSWDEALDLTAGKFREALATTGPDSVAYYGSGQALTEESYLVNKIFKAGFKSNNVEGNPRLCMASAVGGYVSTFGKDEPMGCYEDIERANCMFILGSNTSECHPVIFKKIASRKQADKSVKVIVVDPRKTNTSRIADMHLAIAPGQDLALLHSMAWVIINEELDDFRFHSKYVTFRVSDDKTATFEEYKAFLEQFRPEKVEAAVGVPAADIYTAAKVFAQSPATTSMWCMGANQRIRGVWVNNLIHNLHLITGKIGKPGSTPLSLTGQPNACGGVRDTGSLSHLLPAGRLVAKQEHRNQLEEQWGLPKDSLNPKPGLHTTAM